MPTLLVVMLASLGCIGNLADFLVCSLVQDRNTATMRGLEQILDLLTVGIYVAGIVYLYCGDFVNKSVARVVLFIALGLMTEFMAIATYGLFMGIWKQGQPDIIDFYKQVALLVLAYLCLKWLYFVIVMLLFNTYFSQPKIWKPIHYPSVWRYQSLAEYPHISY